MTSTIDWFIQNPYEVREINRELHPCLNLLLSLLKSSSCRWLPGVPLSRYIPDVLATATPQAFSLPTNCSRPLTHNSTGTNQCWLCHREKSRWSQGWADHSRKNLPPSRAMGNDEVWAAGRQPDTSSVVPTWRETRAAALEPEAALRIGVEEK